MTKLTIAELAEQAGTTPRTARYYIAEGLLPKAQGTGRRGNYVQEHLDLLKRILALKAEGLTLDQIRFELVEGIGGGLPPMQDYTAFRLASDVEVHVKKGLSPWRAWQIREWLSQSFPLIDDGPKESDDA